MGHLFRSEKMSLCQIFLQPEAAYVTVAQLGETGCVQFRDMNEGITLYQRKFVSEVRRCEDLERKIRLIDTEIKKYNLYKFLCYTEPAAPKPREIIDLESKLDRCEVELMELAQNEMKLKSNFLELTEMLIVLECTQRFFFEESIINMELTDDDHGQSGNLEFLAGVVSVERQHAFERMLWRVAHGKAFIKTQQLNESLKDPKTGSQMYKTVFVIFFQGEQLRNKIMKICNGFHASLYACPQKYAEREEMITGIRTRLDDLNVVLKQTSNQRQSVLLTACKRLAKWSIMIKKMKAVYHTLNMLSVDVTYKCLIGECWIPEGDLNNVRLDLATGSAASGSTLTCFLDVLETDETPPTYNKTNKFTHGFQNLIDAYGVASYREANPALYTCISFPFLFAVMFGDMGHGLVLFLVGISMVIWEKSLAHKWNGEIWKILFGGRYIILLMGLFAIYTGFIYNDIFSKSFNIFGSSWRIHYNTSTVLDNYKVGLTLDPRYAVDGVYAMGMDPIWQLAKNKIIFLNTYKMKLSIIIGVLHMVFGVCMSVVNFAHFKRYASIVLEFLPQLIFLLLLFGYMVFMMFFKMSKYSAKSDEQLNTPGCAPSVLIMFINMVLFKSSTVEQGCDELMFSNQSIVQIVFVILAVICIPWMLMGKPLYIQYTRKNKLVFQHPQDFTSTDNLELIEAANDFVLENLDTTSKNVIHFNEDYEDAVEEPMSEIWIHQAIHTIEYVLSTISHTASYLRLWALSLAHAQLSEVLWTMVLSLSLKTHGYLGAIVIFFIFAVWVFFTISIMVLMEGLSAFLHTLRLHWVEFMSKFYEGAGYSFQPFCFKTILEAEDDL